jgi:fermentation-respiration switch protein FrsA (DUF1100 family)
MVVLQTIGIALVALIGLIIIYLTIVIFAPGFKVPKQPLPTTVSSAGETSDQFAKERKEISFEVQGMKVSAWLYLPEDLTAPVPCIVLNTGFGGTKGMILESYALRFREAGFAALTYDYRYFGESEGQPRQMFSVRSQLEDCRGAISYARSLKEIDPERISLWGTSAGGGYGLVIAAQDKQIACVCAQCAGLDRHRDGKMALKREGIGFLLRLFMHAQRDKGRSRFGLSPHKIPIVGKPGTLAMLIAPGAFEGYARLVSPGFINEVCPRALLTTHGYNPINSVKEVKCPVLLQICEQDNLVSMDSALETAKILGDYADVKRYPIGHFDIYTGDHFERSVGDQVEFFSRQLMLKEEEAGGRK